MLALVAGAALALVGSRVPAATDKRARLAACEEQRRSTELVVPVVQRHDGFVLVSAHRERGEPIPPARGDVVVTRAGTYLVGEGRVLPLDASCDAAIEVAP